MVVVVDTRTIDSNRSIAVIIIGAMPDGWMALHSSPGGKVCLGWAPVFMEAPVGAHVLVLLLAWGLLREYIPTHLVGILLLLCTDALFP